MLQYKRKSISLPKFGNSSNENEDNILDPINSDDTLLKFAVSDGATESSFSKEWSDLLVSSYKDKLFDKEHLSDTIKQISRNWEVITNIENLPWYAQQKAEIGAFAAFLGLTINRVSRTYDCIAVGDCTFFQIRNDKLLMSFPIINFEQFSNTPKLFSTNSKYQIDFACSVEYTTGDIAEGDIILLATDALAAWILKSQNDSIKPWNQLDNILDIYISDFESWLNNKRKEGKIKNDDVTLLILKFE